MAKKIFTFIFPTNLIVILLSIGIITWMFSGFFRDYYMDMTKEKLQSNAFSIRNSVASEIESKDYIKLSELVDEVAEKTNNRITVIGNDGLVLADSNEDPKQMENHATPDRREVLDAIRGELGYSVRYSSTLKKDTMYVAVPVYINNKVVAVVRTSFFIDSMYRFLNNTYSHIVGLALVVAAVAICISYVLSRQIANPLEKIKSTASAFSKGDFRAKTPDSAISEIQDLSKSMNIMSTEIQENINEITQQKNDLKLILSSMNEGVIAIDLDDKIMSINSAARKILNTDFPVSSSDIGNNNIENTLFKNVNNEDLRSNENLYFRETIRNTDVHKFIDEILKSGKNLNRKIELMGLRSKIVEIHGAVLRNASGESLGVLLVVNDITQVSQLENMRKNFAANVSHELKTPLTAIKGAVETLIEGAVQDPEDAEKFLKIIDKHSDRLNSLISDIMSLSKIEQEKESDAIDLNPCQLKNIIDTSVEFCQNKADSRNISIKVDCKENLKVYGNEQMLEQVFINLIDNAVKFSPENDQVKIKASQKGQIVNIEITDHGCGIPEEHIPRLFERFYRVDKGRSRQQGGTGLGLAIVKHIINLHNGTVEVISEPGKETIFTVKIPYSLDTV